MVETSLVPSFGVLPVEADAIESLARRAAEEARALTGCERVVVYRFASDVATVIAESSAAANDAPSSPRARPGVLARRGGQGRSR